MKLTLILIASIMVVGHAFALTEQQAMQQGLQAYESGDLVTARTYFQMVLDNNPKHPTARAYLKRVEIDEKKPKPVTKRLETVQLTDIKFTEATLDSVLTYLVEATKTASGGKVDLNFVPELSPEEMKLRRVTLNLGGSVPLLEVLRYVGRLAEVEFRSDPHALIVVDKRTAAPEPAEKEAVGLGN